MADNTHKTPTQQGVSDSSKRSNTHVIIAELICVVAFIFVFLILWIGYNDKYHDCPNIAFRFCHGHASDILMAVLVAFLATVLYVAGALRDDLVNHRQSWEASQEQLMSYGKQLTTDSDRLRILTTDVQEETKTLGRLAKNMLKIHDLAEKSVNRTALAGIQDKSFEWTEKWAELIFRENFPMPAAGALRQQIEKAAIEYATSKCLALMYSSYVSEEVRSISSDGLPLLTTNYPTYLGFLSKLATSFVDDIGPIENSVIEAELKKHKVYIVTLADILPVGFLMLCRPKSNQTWECELDSSTPSQLVQWRKVSSQLSQSPNCFFKRVFITGDFPLNEIPVPTPKQFKMLLECYIWSRLRDIDLSLGFNTGFVEVFKNKLGIKSPDFLDYKPNSAGFYIGLQNHRKQDTQASLDIGSETVEVNDKPISVKDFLIDHVHSKQKDSVGWCDIDAPNGSNKKNLRDILKSYKKGFPTDMFVIGLMPSDAKPEEWDKIKPIIGVACCQVFGLRGNVCTLELYFGQQLDGGPQSVWSWVKELLRNADQIP